jgi:hypothetical protein
MSWRYSVFPCTNETDDHSTCEAFGGPPADTFWGDGWKDAYRKAEELPHAVVERAYKGDQGWVKTPFVVFEHIEGGGVCFYCRKGRGPLCNTLGGNRFMCDSCRADERRGHEQVMRSYGTEPSRFRYVPIIETLDF